MKRQQLAIIAAAIALVYLSILLPLEAGAQDNPPETPQISATWWVPTPTPVIVRPMPLGPCKIAPGCALLPIVVTP